MRREMASFYCNILQSISPSPNSKALVLLLAASVTYMVAMVTNWWFTMPPHSYYGLWSVTFCDFLHCQLIPAFGDAPGWYPVVQVLSILGYIFLLVSDVLVASTVLSKYIPGPCVCKPSRKISGVCMLSAIFMSTSAVVFYSSLLMESSPKYRVYISWSSAAAFFSCLLELSAAVLLS